MTQQSLSDTLCDSDSAGDSESIRVIGRTPAGPRQLSESRSLARCPLADSEKPGPSRRDRDGVTRARDRAVTWARPGGDQLASDSESESEDPAGSDAGESRRAARLAARASLKMTVLSRAALPA